MPGLHSLKIPKRVLLRRSDFFNHIGLSRKYTPDFPQRNAENAMMGAVLA